MLMDHAPTCRMQTEVRGQDPAMAMMRGGFLGRGRGWGRMGLGRGRGQLIYYNCGGPGHYTWDCTNPTRISCPYCEKFDHELLDCPKLITQIRDKKATPLTTTQNVQMMRSEPGNDQPMVNMVVRSGAATGAVNKENNMEAWESFTGIFTRGSRDRPELSRDPLDVDYLLRDMHKIASRQQGS